MKEKSYATALDIERALVVGVDTENNPYFMDSIEELKNLARACAIEPVGEIVQNLPRHHPALYVGTGKLDEIVDFVDREEIDVVIFEDELSPSQIRNLSKYLPNAEILDRTRLILEIFKSRAQTKEAKLQVEIARLRYALPRLRDTNQNFSRQRGGTGTKNRGAGETKLELDRRKVELKITELERDLKAIELNRQVRRKKRSESGVPIVALVGYTNAGKSTLMNGMVSLFKEDEEKLVFEKDMLFATLDTSVRSIKFDSGKQILLSDTVGFISKLPHNLVKAFRSTLEEVREADLLLHVIDCSNPYYPQQIKVTNDTLKHIDADQIPQIFVYNKVDLIAGQPPIQDGATVHISAKKRLGYDELITEITKAAFSNFETYKLLIPFDKGQLISYLKDSYGLNSLEYVDNGTLVEVDLAPSDFDLYKEYIVK